MSIDTYKVVFVGDVNVGKTSIVSRYVNNKMDDKYVPTLGLDYIAKHHTVDDEMVKFQMWDVAGQERFRSLVNSYMKGTHVGIVVYDVTNMSSFHNCKVWIDLLNNKFREFLDVGKNADDFVLVLVGNKSDLVSDRQVQTEDAESFAACHNAMFFETSAKTGYQVKDMFSELARTLIAKRQFKDDASMYSMEVAAKNTASAATNCWRSCWRALLCC